MTKFKNYIINKLIQHQQDVKPMYPLGVSITGSLLFILYDNLEKKITENHYDIYCYDFKTNTSLNMMETKDGILNQPIINFTCIYSLYSYYTFDGKRLIKHIIL